ncbi:MAG: sulfur carrier protein ThiS [Vicinamibacterales bacterium]
MRIRLNGDPADIEGPKTILQLLEDLKIDPRIVAVEQNLTILKRDRYATAAINEGDEIEIVNFVGGG